VPDHLLSWLVGVAVGCLVTLAVTLATQVRLLPEVVDVSIIPTWAGIGSLAAAAFGALRRFPPERIGRLTLFGTLTGGGVAAAVLAAFFLLDVLS
jgi:hypothetical protein